MKDKIEYQFTNIIWRHDAPGGWYFISLPKTISKEIRTHLGWQEEGWGRMKTIAQIGNIKWNTAIWFDTKMETYILPLKAEIRKKCNLETDKSINISIWI